MPSGRDSRQVEVRITPDEGGRPYLTLVAFGERHPQRGTRAVYERAHKAGRAVSRPPERGGLDR